MARATVTPRSSDRQLELISQAFCLVHWSCPHKEAGSICFAFGHCLNRVALARSLIIDVLRALSLIRAMRLSPVVSRSFCSFP